MTKHAALSRLHVAFGLQSPSLNDTHRYKCIHHILNNLHHVAADFVEFTMLIAFIIYSAFSI
jgi:hypothetical protein